jgi:hypothetical protein
MRTGSGTLVRGIFVAMILVVTWTALLWQARRISQLQRENRMLRGEIQAGGQEANSKVANAQAALDEELTRLRAEAREVHKLRNEMSQLRVERSESEKLRAENQRLKTASISDGSSAVQAVQQPEFFAKENWIFAGHATPEATVQTFLWAMREGDLKTLQAGVTAEAQIEKVWVTRNSHQAFKRGSGGRSETPPATASSSGKPFLKMKLSCGSTRQEKEAAQGTRIFS